MLELLKTKNKTYRQLQDDQISVNTLATDDLATFPKSSFSLLNTNFGSWFFRDPALAAQDVL